MSKNIWHKADIAPDLYRSFVINTDKRNIYTGIITNPTEWNPMILPEFYSIGDIDKAERAIRYAYLDDLLALETELERTRKALDYAIDVIQKVAKMSDKLSREYGETFVEQLDNIQAYCWQEGYVLTHEQDLERAITALEQKD